MSSFYEYLSTTSNPRAKNWILNTQYPACRALRGKAGRSILDTLYMSWTSNAVIYQIYPRSFRDSDGNGIGDIGGIIEKIPYLTELGVDAVWLSPIYKSPQKDFGYDVEDYLDIDPIFGDINLFDKLVSKLHENGIKIIMDFIPNHTSSKHPWFVESKSNKENPKRDWYIWRDGKENKPPNNWESVFGGSAWTFDESTNQYYFHAFDQQQPDLNFRNPDVKEAVLNIMRYWLERGVDGFRTDAVDFLFEEEHLKDEPLNPEYSPGFAEYTDRRLLHIYTKKLPESIDLLKDFAHVVQEYEDRFLTTEPDPSTSALDEIMKMYKTVDWHSYHPFNFSLINLPWLAAPHKEYIDEYEQRLDDHYIPCYVTGNHDKPRVITRIGPRQARNAALLLLTLRGNAFVYNGEEIGMSNRIIPKKFQTDTYDLRSPGLGLGRNGERTPMQWDDSTHAGFTDGQPWLPVALNYKKTNVEFERLDPKSFFNLYKNLITLKKSHPALSQGEYIPIDSPAENVFAYVRKHKETSLLILVNFDNSPKKIAMNYSGKVVINTFLDKKAGNLIDLSNFTLRADEGIVISI